MGTLSPFEPQGCSAVFTLHILIILAVAGGLFGRGIDLFAAKVAATLTVVAVAAV